MAIRQGGIVPRRDIALTILEDMPNLLTSFVATRVFPVFSVGISSGPIPKVLRRNRVERLYKPKYGEFPTGQLVVDTAGTFDCQEAGFDELLDEKDKEILGGGGGNDRAMMIAGLKALQTHMLARDAALATVLMTTGTFGSGYNTAGAGTWGGASDEPITDVTAAVEKVRMRCGKRANRLLISGGAYTKLLQSPNIQASFRALRGIQDGQAVGFLIGNKDLAILLGLDAYGDGEVIVADAAKNTADEGLTAVLASVWDDTKALVFYSSPPNDLVSPGLGKTFVWDKAEGVLGSVAAPVANIQSTYDQMMGVIVEQVYDVLRNVERARVREYLDMLLLNKEAGHLLTGI